MGAITASCPRNGRAGARARNRFLKGQTDETPDYLPTRIGSQNVKLPLLSAPQRRGWGRNLGAPYAKPRGQQTEGLSTPFEGGSSGVK